MKDRLPFSKIMNSIKIYIKKLYFINNSIPIYYIY